MTKYIIRTTETGPLAPTQPLWWTGEGVVGICRASEAIEYDTPLAAAWALAGIAARKVKFYQLEVSLAPQPMRWSSRGNGWMVRHPGYDLMH